MCVIHALVSCEFGSGCSMAYGGVFVGSKTVLKQIKILLEK